MAPHLLALAWPLRRAAPLLQPASSAAAAATAGAARQFWGSPAAQKEGPSFGERVADRAAEAGAHLLAAGPGARLARLPAPTPTT